MALRTGPSGFIRMDAHNELRYLVDMDRNWVGECTSPECRHPAADHLATPEMISHGVAEVRFCQRCFHHEIVPIRRWSHRVWSS